MIEVSVQGAGYARGIAHGRLLGPLIRERISRLGQRDEEANRVLPPLWAHFEQAVPDYAAEVRGIADGAGAPLEDVFTLTAGAEVFYHRSTWLEECTNIAAVKGPPVLAKNSDGDARLERYRCVQRVAPDTGQRSIRVAWIGAVGVSIGVNEAGVGYVGASLPASSIVDVGVPPLVIAAEALDRARSAAEAVEIASQHRVTGHGYQAIWADRTGAVMRLELLPGSVQAQEAGSPWTVHANWPLIPASLPFASANSDFRQNSAKRVQRARSYARAWSGHLSTLEDLMRTHGAGGLCRHEGDVGLTIFSGIARTEDSSLLLTDGPPCAHSYVRYPLSAPIVQ